MGALACAFPLAVEATVGLWALGGRPRLTASLLAVSYQELPLRQARLPSAGHACSPLTLSQQESALVSVGRNCLGLEGVGLRWGHTPGPGM